MERIGILGAGVMGSDLALNLAALNFQVVVRDISTEALDKSAALIRKNLKMLKMMNKQFRQLDEQRVLEKVSFTRELDFVKGSDILIESISENVEMKRELYRELNPLLQEDTMIGINTSCIPITDLASELAFPEKVVGMHFMNPVVLKDVVEVVRGFHTTDKTIEHSKSFLKAFHKTAIVVNDYPGFVTNRLSHLFMNEAAFLVQDQVASPKDIDALFRKGYGHAMGPLETADLIGLDTVVNSLEVLYENYQDTKFRCCPLLKKMVRAGLLGKKSGEGFYKY